MGRTVVPTGGRAGELIDALRVQNTILCAAQARAAELMVEFADVRKHRDKQRISDLKREGVDPIFRAGEFAAREIGAAVCATNHTVQRVVGMARRLQAECPDAYDAWKAGDICQDRVVRINRALRRLVFDSSKQVLNATVVDVAVGQTPELLGRWLNQFVARMEPEEQDERLHRAMEDRYASVRPDLDGMSFLSALMSSVDAAAVERILTALAAAAEPGDLRTMAQRRSDALVDMLCGRVSNGCHVLWDANDDSDDSDDDSSDTVDEDSSDRVDDEPRGSGERQPTGCSPGGDHLCGSTADHEPGDRGASGCRTADIEVSVSEPRGGQTDTADSDTDSDTDTEPVGQPSAEPDSGRYRTVTGSEPDPDRESGGDFGLDEGWRTTDWEQPPSVFRPDPRGRPDHSGSDDSGEPDPAPDREPLPLEIAGRTGNGTWRVTPCPGEHQVTPAPVTIGVVVSIQSLFGASTMPGQLMDRSALVPAEQIRELAQQKGTLFYRLLTDDKGHLLDVTEMGRFPSRKLGMAIKFRDGTCTGPTCHQSAEGCDMDHITPHPEGPTTAINLNNDCRPEHRAKTFAGHSTARTGPHTTTWTTPTGHTYTSQDPPLPVEQWPGSDRPKEALSTPTPPAASRPTPQTGRPTPSAGRRRKRKRPRVRQSRLSDGSLPGVAR